MLISRKVMKDKRVVTDIRHLNIRIAKNNLAYPLLKDTFFVLDSSRYEVLLVLDLKDAFHSLNNNNKQYICYSTVRNLTKCNVFSGALQLFTAGMC